jgi:hypothetical protein
MEVKILHRDIAEADGSGQVLAIPAQRLGVRDLEDILDVHGGSGIGHEHGRYQLSALNDVKEERILFFRGR